MSAAGGKLLVVDDKKTMLQLLERILSQHHTVETADDGSQALALIADRDYEVILTDVRMPGADGLQVLRAAKARAASTEVIVMTAFASVESAVEAMRLGAYDYLQKPFDPDDVVLVVARALERKRLRETTATNEAAPGLTPAAAAEAAVGREAPPLSYREAVNHARDQFSREYLSALLRAFDGNVTRAAQHARLERESLHRLLKKYQLRAEAFRTGGEGGSGPEGQ